ncbi:MAG: 1-acyl-sn-glycerol-3-phosphate acyltransferase [Anaerolineales bacterium]|nr:1-acyl-sn-glycerol-3-phosphate acyltransferase [Anaerolineales bacterium]
MITATKTSKTTSIPYNHQSWEMRRKLCRFLLNTIAFPWLVKLDRVEGIENIPAQGSAILLINHIAFIDPIVVLHIMPRNIVPLAKIEVYEYPIVGIFPRIWGVIPVRRNEVDRIAISKAIDVLNAGEIILVAPEGTRNDELQRGREGIAYLASRTGSPVIPVALENTCGYPTYPFSKRWRQEGASVRIGRPFCYSVEYANARMKLLRKMTDEAMYILAKMLPENRRGVYSDLSEATMETIKWCE